MPCTKLTLIFFQSESSIFNPPRTVAKQSGL